MPTTLPVRTPNKPKPASKSVVARPLPEGFNIWVACVGLAGTILAAFIYYFGGDSIGAALFLVLAAIVIVAMMRTCAADRRGEV
ncbi:MAG: hypothetical protein HY244_13720 [Rhizobiales bacterium]|nr:hypothetical protein [Hyphomicrobiales bacterium]